MGLASLGLCVVSLSLKQQTNKKQLLMAAYVLQRAVDRLGGADATELGLLGPF